MRHNDLRPDASRIFRGVHNGVDYLWFKPVDKFKKYGFEADLALLIKIYAVDLAALDLLSFGHPRVHFSIQNALGESALD